MNLAQSVHERAKKYPEQVAYEFMNEQYTYGYFEQSVSKFAGALKQNGVKKGRSHCFIGRKYTTFHHYLICKLALRSGCCTY